MRRVVAISFMLALALVAVAVVRPAAGHGAQGATPGAAGIELAPGVIAEIFAGVPSDRAPGQTLYVFRATFELGSELGAHRHPGTTLISVDSGALGWTLLEGTAHVIRGAAAGATGPTEDLTEPGSEVVLDPGDALYYEDDGVHTARAVGDEPAVILGSFLYTTGEPPLLPVGTPAAGTPAA